jgi:hypothetical protein
MGHLYGDSTMFPFAPDFIEIVRHAVDAGVQLLAAQHAIGKARKRTDSVEQQRQSIKAQLASLGDAVSSALEPFVSGRSERAARVSKLIRERSKELIAAEEQSLEGAVSEKMGSSVAAIEAARESSFRAIETFVLRHDLPDTDVGLHLVAEESRYRGQALVTTPFGIEAVFDLAIPAAHDWGQPRRVVELSAGTEVHVPMESGIFTKKIEPKPVKLDRLFITEVAISNARTLITMRKGVRGAPARRRAADRGDGARRAAARAPLGRARRAGPPARRGRGAPRGGLHHQGGAVREGAGAPGGAAARLRALRAGGGADQPACPDPLGAYRPAGAGARERVT